MSVHAPQPPEYVAFDTRHLFNALTPAAFVSVVAAAHAQSDEVKLPVRFRFKNTFMTVNAGEISVSDAERRAKEIALLTAIRGRLGINRFTSAKVTSEPVHRNLPTGITIDDMLAIASDSNKFITTRVSDRLIVIAAGDTPVDVRTAIRNATKGHVERRLPASWEALMPAVENFDRIVSRAIPAGAPVSYDFTKGIHCN